MVVAGNVCICVPEFQAVSCSVSLAKFHLLVMFQLFYQANLSEEKLSERKRDCKPAINHNHSHPMRSTTAYVMLQKQNISCQTERS